MQARLLNAALRLAELDDQGLLRLMHREQAGEDQDQGECADDEAENDRKTVHWVPPVLPRLEASCAVPPCGTPWARFRSSVSGRYGTVPEAVARLFDVVVLGGALGVRKPDPEVFRRVAGLLKVAPTECVVVDDLARNVRGATAAGAVGVLHRAVSLTVEEVEILLDLP